MGSALHEFIPSQRDRGCTAHGSETDQAAHVYNALNCRIIKRADNDLDKSLHQQRIMTDGHCVAGIAKTTILTPFLSPIRLTGHRVGQCHCSIKAALIEVRRWSMLRYVEAFVITTWT